MLCLIPALAGVSVAATSLEGQGRPNSGHIQHRPTVEQNGFFYGESQHYIVSPPLINVYYRINADSERAQARGVSGTKAGPDLGYCHEVFSLRPNRWAKVWANFSDKPANYLDGRACDTSNSLDVPAEAMATALPRASKVKSLENREKYALLVYSDTSERTEFYALKTVLLVPEAGEWRAKRTLYSGDAQNFCGHETFQAPGQNGRGRLIFLLYLGDQDSSGQYFISIQSFLVRE